MGQEEERDREKGMGGGEMNGEESRSEWIEEREGREEKGEGTIEGRKQIGSGRRNEIIK